MTPGGAEVIFGSTSGVQYSSPVGSVGQMLLGENDTVFAAGAFSGVAALNLQTGSPIWQRPGAVDLTAALADGRLVVDDFSAGVLTSIDAAGQATPLFVPPSGGTSALTLSGASALTFGSGSYYSFGGWAGALDFERLALAYDTTVDIAASGYAEMGMNPQKSNAKRVRSFQLIWLNSFYFYKDYPQIDESTRQDLTGPQVDAMLQEALTAFRAAFAAYNVDVGVGRQGTNTIRVEDGFFFDPQTGKNACATTAQAGVSRVSVAYYQTNMEQAQWALQSSVLTPEMVMAIGRGIANNAAHELGHQFRITGMDDASLNTYNGGSCDGLTSPAIYDGTAIRWGDASAAAWQSILGPR